MPGMRRRYQAGYHRRTEQSLLLELPEVERLQNWYGVEHRFSGIIHLFPQLKQQALKGHGFSRAVKYALERASAPEGTRTLSQTPNSLSG